VKICGWRASRESARTTGYSEVIGALKTPGTTDDAVFDDTLRQGLEVQLEQSPFLSIVSSERMRQTLRLMNQRPRKPAVCFFARAISIGTRSPVVSA